MNAQNLQLLGEFVGTMVLVTMGDGTVANAVLNKSRGKAEAGFISSGAGPSPL